VDFFVMPTEEGLPPRALVGEIFALPGAIAIENATMAVWTADVGAWCVEGVPVPEELGEHITERARELGVPWS